MRDSSILAVTAYDNSGHPLIRQAPWLGNGIVAAPQMTPSLRVRPPEPEPLLKQPEPEPLLKQPVSVLAPPPEAPTQVETLNPAIQPIIDQAVSQTVDAIASAATSPETAQIAQSAADPKAALKDYYLQVAAQSLDGSWAGTPCGAKTCPGDMAPQRTMSDEEVKAVAASAAAEAAAEAGAAIESAVAESKPGGGFPWWLLAAAALAM